MAARGTVIAGFDGSPEARRAVWWAATEAASRKQPLHIVYAFTVPLEELVRIHLPSEALEQDALRSTAEQEIAALVDEFRKQLPQLEVFTDVQLGHPAEILAGAAAEGALLVLGAPRRSKMRRALLGSTAAELVRKAPVPLVIVREENTPVHEVAGTSQVNNVVVGVDGSQRNMRAIEFALDFADRHGAELKAILAWNGLPTDAIAPRSGWRLDWYDITNACRRELSESLAGAAERYPSLTIEQEVTTTQSPAEALLTAAETADLLVVGTRGRGSIQAALLGSVSHAIVHYAPCPIAVTR